MTALSGVLLWLKTITKDDAHTSGEKAVQLGDLLQSDFPVPDGFVLTSLAYFHFLHENKLIPKINKLIETINFEQPESVMQVASYIQKLIMTTKFSESFITDVTRAYNKLCGAFKNAPVTVSLPHEIISNVHGDANLLLKIKQAWITLFTPEALINRHNKQINHFQEGIAIIIQKMVNADTSGIVLTSDPVTHDRSKLIIETIADTTDHFVVNKNSNEIREKNIAGTHQQLTDQQILALADLGKKLEKQLYFPQEIHFAIERGLLYIVQTKPLHMQNPLENHSSIAAKLPLLLKGIPASHGIRSGIVRKIESIKDFEHITHGDIIVAVELTTDHKDSLKKASGFVTDRGGRTSPIALLAREWGIPAVVGTTHITKTVKNGEHITINGSQGEIYKGASTNASVKQNKTRVVELLSASMVNERRNDFTDGAFVMDIKPEQIAVTLESTCTHFGSHPVIYRLMHAKSQGTDYLVHHPESLKKELALIKELKNNPDCRNLGILLPAVRTVHELTTVKHIMNEFGLSRSAHFPLWIELATPGSLILFNEFIENGIDGITIDIDMVTMLMLGIDKNNDEAAHAFDPASKAVLQLIENVIKTARTHGVSTAIYGRSLLHRPSLIEKVVGWKITDIAVEPTHVDQIRKQIIETERRLIENP